MPSVLKHHEDEGDLSVFASGNVVLISCSKGGHYWVIDAEQHSSETVKSVLQEALSQEDADALISVL
jgi:hypothetical protein